MATTDATTDELPETAGAETEPASGPETLPSQSAPELDPGDPIHAAALAVENLTKDQALERARALVHKIGHHSFELGGVLASIHDHAWWTGSSFKEWVESDAGMGYRRAMYLIRVYERLLNAGASGSKVEGIGWTKLQVIAQVVTAETLDSWLDKARTQRRDQLRKAIRSSLKADDAGSKASSAAPCGGDQVPDSTQAITSAETECGPHHDNAAVPVSTSDVAEEPAMPHPVTPKEATLEECKTVLYAFMKRIRDIEDDNMVSATAILEVFEQIFPHADIEVAV